MHQYLRRNNTAYASGLNLLQMRHWKLANNDYETFGPHSGNLGFALKPALYVHGKRVADVLREQLVLSNEDFQTVFDDNFLFAMDVLAGVLDYCNHESLLPPGSIKFLGLTQAPLWKLAPTMQDEWLPLEYPRFPAVVFHFHPLLCGPHHPEVLTTTMEHIILDSEWCTSTSS